MAQRIGAKVIQDMRRDGPGWSRLQLTGIAVPSSGVLEVRFRRGNEPPYLGPTGWQTGGFWILLEEITDIEGGIEALVPPDINEALVNTVAAIQFRCDESELPGEARVAWPGVILAGTATAPSAVNEVVDLAPTRPENEDTKLGSMPDSMVLEPEAQAVTAELKLKITRNDQEVTPHNQSHSGMPRWAVASLLLLLVTGVGSGLWWLSTQEGGNPIITNEPTSLPDVGLSASEAPATVITSLEEFDAWLIDVDPDGEQVASIGDAFSDRADNESALLIYREAIRRGSDQASKRVARWYDPAKHTPEAPVARPSAERAIRYYEPAAKAGDAEAVFRMGALMMDGGSGAAGEYEEGVIWIQRAARDGYEPAQQFLDEKSLVY